MLLFNDSKWLITEGQGSRFWRESDIYEKARALIIQRRCPSYEIHYPDALDTALPFPVHANYFVVNPRALIK